jgi:hypothetical protein
MGVASQGYSIGLYDSSNHMLRSFEKGEEVFLTSAASNSYGIAAFDES